MTQPKVLLLTGGAWWSSTTPNNLGHQFLLHTLATSEKRDYPLKIYICTRTPPPAGALEEYENRFRVSRDGENSDSHQSTLHHLPLDLSSPSSIRQCVARFSSLEDRLDFLVLNAAVAPSARHLSSYTITLPSVTPCPEGDDPDDAEPKSERRWQVEDTFLVNVLGNGMLWQLLEPAMKQPSIDDQVGEEDRVRARVVVVSSELHRRCQAIKVDPSYLDDVLGETGWNGMTTYKVTKLIQTIYAYGKKVGLDKEGVDVLTVSPGFVPNTALSRSSSFPLRILMSWVMPRLFFATSPQEGGKRIWETVFEVPAAAEKGQDQEAFYLKESKKCRASPEVYDPVTRHKWMKFIGSSINEIFSETSES